MLFPFERTSFRLMILGVGALVSVVPLLIVSYYLNSIQPGTATLSNTYGQVSLMAAGCGFLLCYLLTYSSLKQISAISRFIELMGVGDFEARIGDIKEDEIGRIARTYNGLLDYLHLQALDQSEVERLQGSIMNLLDEISELASGDLTVRAVVTDEITGVLADSFNMMAEQMSMLLINIKETASEVESASKESSRTSEQLATRSLEHGKKTNEAAISVGDLAKDSQLISDKAEQSAKVSNQSMVSAKAGAEAVTNTNNAIQSIRENVQLTAKGIKRLGESSQEIQNVVKIIDVLADRTSILALNASIQAAMAGEAGHGFAVVADEVHRLAEQSSDSAKQIESLVTTILREINEATVSMDESIDIVVEGSKLAGEAQLKLEDIQKISVQLGVLISMISTTAKQQRVNSEGISNLMTDLAKENSETAESNNLTTVSMHSLAETAEQMFESIGAFKLEK